MAADETLKKLEVILTANTQQLQSAMAEAEKSTAAATSAIQDGFAKVDSVFKSVAKAAAAYLSVNAIKSFGEACLDAGAELTKMQNLVRTSFGEYSGSMEKFAADAIGQFGIADTTAMKYASTLNSLFKSMDVGAKDAYDMSTALTGLSGDIASFYNISEDEAYEKLRSAMSGRAMGLKSLGIAMEDTNLEAYALSQGIKKSYSEMTQAEQVALRYKYILQQTQDIQGNFARNSNEWGAQVKILGQRFDSLKASLGQSLSIAFTPVIKAINTVIEYITALTDKFYAFIKDITGTDLTKSTGDMSQTLTDSEEAAADVGDTMTKSMDKADKSVKRFLMGFDEIHKLGGETSPVDEEAIDALTSPQTLGGMQDLTDTTQQENEALAGMKETLEAVKNAIEPVIEKTKQLAGEFKDGFMSGLGNDIGERFKGVAEDVKSIGNSLYDIFTDDKVMTAASQYADKVAYALGQVAGSVVSIGVTIAENLIGGIESFLKDNGERIKDWLSDMFTIKGDIAEMLGNFSQSVADILSVFGDANGQELTGNIIGIFSNAFMSVSEIVTKIWRDVVGFITKPITMNVEGIKNALNDILGIAAKITGTIEEAVVFIGDKANEVYDQHIKPLIDSITNGIAQFIETIIDNWNTRIKPMLDEWATKIQELWDTYLKPFFDKLGDMIGSVADALKLLWENVLQPIVNFLINDIIQNMLPTLNAAFDTVIATIGAIAEALSGVWDMLSGLLDFIVGVFTGDLEKAVESAKKAVLGVQEFIDGIGRGIVDFFGGVLNTVLEFIGGIFTGIKDAVGGIIDFFAGIFGLKSENSPTNSGYTLEQAIAEGKTRTVSGSGLAYNAMQSTGVSRDEMYGAVSDALADQDGGEIALYIDGEQMATALDRSRSYRNTRINPALAY